MSPFVYLGKILCVDPDVLEHLDAHMSRALGKHDVLVDVAEKNHAHVRESLKKLKLDETATTEEVQAGLLGAIEKHENQFIKRVKKAAGATIFDKAANLAKEIANVSDGYFLKKEFAEHILQKRPPENLLAHLKYKNVNELLAKHDVTEAFSALRFMESDAWMHETFEKAYSNFTAKDFEVRPIELKALGPEWKDVAEKFVAKKHHNVSHLKEFGVIFLNPINEDLPGKFLRDFALLFHYLHEVDFYAKLFKAHSEDADFSDRLKSLLRGDVKEAGTLQPGEWMIIQRYLWKENPSDPRLFIPQVNPESIHWRRGERDITALGKREKGLDLDFWEDRDWVAMFCKDGEALISLDLEDNAMSLVSEKEGKKGEFFTYHQHEALWTYLFESYVGGEAEMARLVMKHFQDGIIRF